MENIENKQIAQSELAISIDEFKKSLKFLDFKEDIAIAVSGGADSMALCFLLSRLYPELARNKLHALTVDHGIREESAKEAQNVSEWVSSTIGARSVILKSDVEIGSDTKVMEKARELRYRLLSEYCQKNQIKKLYVAHHLNDQSETFLFRLAKGSGLDGLSAMHKSYDYNKRLEILRPLLPFSKDRLILTCTENKIPFVSDPTNVNEKYARTRIRNSEEILAKEGLNAKRVSVMAMRFKRAKDALDVYSNKAYQNTLVDDLKDLKSFDYNLLFDEPEEIRIRVIKKALEKFSENAKTTQPYGPRMTKLENLVKKIFNQKGFQTMTLGGCIFSFDANKALILIKKERK
jgi:tRNA(Ile)-lysidine synthase